MNTCRTVLWAVLILLGPGFALAQPGPGPHPGPGPGHPPPEGAPPPPAESPGERWLDMLREFNPEEYDRLAALRTEDPEAFRAELRTRLQQHKKRLMREFGPPGPGHDHPGDDPEDRSREVHQVLERIRPEVERLAAAYRASTDDTARTAIREELSTLVAQVQDARIESHRERIEQGRRMLEALEARLAERIDARDEQINRAVDRILEGRPVPPRKPAEP